MSLNKNFQIRQLIGEGTYSKVYKVMRKVDKQIYAGKIIKYQKLQAREKQNALNQVRILASIKSQYIVSFFQSFIDQNTNNLCIIMQFCQKGDLKNLIKLLKLKKSCFGETQIWKILIHCLQGLQTLHSHSIFHRDIKPANIFISIHNQYKLADLNVAKIAKQGLLNTQTGTPYYASPEIWKQLPYDEKSDLWSLGAVIYQLCQMHPPFQGNSLYQLRDCVISGNYNKISEKYSKEMKMLVMALLNQKTDERPSCLHLLTHSFIRSKSKQLGINIQLQNEKRDLLETITSFENIEYVKRQLPISRYKKNEKGFSESRFDSNTNNYHSINNNKNKMVRSISRYSKQKQQYLKYSQQKKNNKFNLIKNHQVKRYYSQPKINEYKKLDYLPRIYINFIRKQQKINLQKNHSKQKQQFYTKLQKLKKCYSTRLQRRNQSNGKLDQNQQKLNRMQRLQLIFKDINKKGIIKKRQYLNIQTLQTKKSQKFRGKLCLKQQVRQGLKQRNGKIFLNDKLLFKQKY